MTWTCRHDTRTRRIVFPFPALVTTSNCSVAFLEFPKLIINCTNNKNIFNYLGSYCDWLKCHPVLLKSVIPVLLDSISDVTLTSAATQALRDICQECSHDLDRDSLIAILNKCQVCFISSCCTVTSFFLDLFYI